MGDLRNGSGKSWSILLLKYCSPGSGTSLLVISRQFGKTVLQISAFVFSHGISHHPHSLEFDSKFDSLQEDNSESLRKLCSNPGPLTRFSQPAASIRIFEGLANVIQ